MWEKELRGNLKRIPQDEIESILDYYNELFADKSEQGFSEREIIKGFGNPFDVAYKIVYDSEHRRDFVDNTSNRSRGDMQLGNSSSNLTGDFVAQSLHENNGAVQSQQPKERKKRGGIVARIVFFLPFFIVSVTLWSLIIGLTAGGIGGAIGGLGMAVISLTQMGTNARAALSSVGLSLASSGAGLLITVGAFFITKAAVRLTKKYFFIGKRKTKRREEI